MLDLLSIIIPILLTDIINPVLLAAVIFALGSRRPYLNAASILSGWLVIYFVSGIALAAGLEAVLDFLKNPRPCCFVLEAGLGLLLIGLGIRMTHSESGRRKKKDFDDADSLSPAAGFWIGASINLIGMPFAIPYFAVISQILKANLNWTQSLWVLLIYNVLYILPFATVVGIRRILGRESDALFRKINDGVDRISSVIIPLLMILIGGGLVADSVFFFVRGKSLF